MRGQRTGREHRIEEGSSESKKEKSRAAGRFSVPGSSRSSAVSFEFGADAALSRRLSFPSPSPSFPLCPIRPLALPRGVWLPIPQPSSSSRNGVSLLAGSRSSQFLVAKLNSGGDQASSRELPKWRWSWRTQAVSPFRLSPALDPSLPLLSNDLNAGTLTLGHRQLLWTHFIGSRSACRVGGEQARGESWSASARSSLTNPWWLLPASPSRDAQVDGRRVRFERMCKGQGEQQLIQVLRRRVRFVRAGAVFVWEEEEASIRRWTDHLKWSGASIRSLRCYWR